MSLDKHDVVPVDTHVWQIASRDYNLVSATSKTLTDNIYRQIGDSATIVVWSSGARFTKIYLKFYLKIIATFL